MAADSELFSNIHTASLLAVPDNQPVIVDIDLFGPESRTNCITLRAWFQRMFMRNQ